LYIEYQQACQKIFILLLLSSGIPEKGGTSRPAW